MIELSNLTKRFSAAGRPAVDSVFLKVQRGEFLVLLGASGSGKTTTLKMINRLIEPTSGEIRINGQSTSTGDPVALRRSIGYVFQEVGLFPHLSVRENAGLPLRLVGTHPPEADQRVDELLARVDLDPEEYGDRRPQELSGGQRQRVGVARALAASPSVVLMDEPFGAVDPITRAGLQTEIKTLHHDLQLTIVMVTHDLFEALLLADRIGVMTNGKLVALGTPHELLTGDLHPDARALLSAPREQIDRLSHLLTPPADSHE